MRWRLIITEHIKTLSFSRIGLPDQRLFALWDLSLGQVVSHQALHVHREFPSLVEIQVEVDPALGGQLRVLESNF